LGATKNVYERPAGVPMQLTQPGHDIVNESVSASPAHHTNQPGQLSLPSLQWLGRRSVAGGLSLSYARSVVDV